MVSKYVMSRQANSVLIITLSLSSILLVTEIRIRIVDMALIAIQTIAAAWFFVILSIDMGEWENENECYIAVFLKLQIIVH